jgi:hypothetical protein
MGQRVDETRQRIIESAECAGDVAFVGFEVDGSGSVRSMDYTYSVQSSTLASTKNLVWKCV